MESQASIRPAFMRLSPKILLYTLYLVGGLLLQKLATFWASFQKPWPIKGFVALCVGVYIILGPVTQLVNRLLDKLFGKLIDKLFDKLYKVRVARRRPVMLYHKPTGKIILFPREYEARFIVLILENCDNGVYNMQDIIEHIRKYGCDNSHNYTYDSNEFETAKSSEFQLI